MALSKFSTAEESVNMTCVDFELLAERGTNIFEKSFSVFIIGIVVFTDIGRWKAKNDAICTSVQGVRNL